MKSTILVWFLFLTVFTGRCQNYLPFPDSAAIWVNATLVVNQGFYGDYICSNGDDTLINSKHYTVFEECVSGLYRGAYRDSLGKVFMVPKDSIEEYLLYDFYALPGDTLTFYQEEFGNNLEQYVVQPGDTGMILINGIDRRFVQVGEGQWIEGIGSNKGLFTSQYGNVSNYSIWLYCMSVLDTIQYGYSVSGGTWTTPQQLIDLPCDFVLDAEELEMETIQLSPNPADDMVALSFIGTVESIALIDANGRAFIPEWSFSNGSFYFSTKEYSRGIYFVLVRTKKQILRATLILN